MYLLLSSLLIVCWQSCKRTAGSRQGATGKRATGQLATGERAAATLWLWWQSCNHSNAQCIDLIIYSAYHAVPAACRCLPAACFSQFDAAARLHDGNL